MVSSTSLVANDAVTTHAVTTAVTPHNSRYRQPSFDSIDPTSIPFGTSLDSAERWQFSHFDPADWNASSLEWPNNLSLGNSHLDACYRQYQRDIGHGDHSEGSLSADDNMPTSSCASSPIPDTSPEMHLADACGRHKMK